MQNVGEGRGEAHKNTLSKNVRAAGHVESYMRELGSIPGWLWCCAIIRFDILAENIVLRQRAARTIPAEQTLWNITKLGLFAFCFPVGSSLVKAASFNTLNVQHTLSFFVLSLGLSNTMDVRPLYLLHGASLKLA